MKLWTSVAALTEHMRITPEGGDEFARFVRFVMNRCAYLQDQIDRAIRESSPGSTTP